MCSVILNNSSCEILDELIQGKGEDKQDQLKDEPFGCDGMNLLGKEGGDLAESSLDALAEVLLEKGLAKAAGLVEFFFRQARNSRPSSWPSRSSNS